MAAADLDAASTRAASVHRILGTGFWDYLTITTAARLFLEHPDLPGDRGWSGSPTPRSGDTGSFATRGSADRPKRPGAGFMMRNFLVEALMLLAESAGLDIDEPVFESLPVLAGERRERAGYRR